MLYFSGTMRFTGSINGHSVQIPLDGGSNDSFIQPQLAKFLHLEIQPTAPFKVLVGNGNALQIEGFIKDLHVKVQGHDLKFPVYLLPIASADIILEAAWLATLGPHLVDYQALSF